MKTITIEADMKTLRRALQLFVSTANRIQKQLDVHTDEEVYANRPRILLIQQIVAEHYQVPVLVMTSQCRTTSFVEPRQAAMYLARMLTKHTHETIGRCFGGRDHGTVIYAVKAVQERAQAEPEYGKEIRELLDAAKTRLEDLDVENSKPLLCFGS